MSFLDVKPAETYDVLRRQFRSLCQVADAIEKRSADYAKKVIGVTPAALDSEREVNQRLTDELEAANARISDLERQLAVERRPIVDRSPGAGPASRRQPAYLGLTPRYARYGQDMVKCIEDCCYPHDPYELHCHIGEPFAYLRHDNDELGRKLAESDGAVLELIHRLDVKISDYPKGHAVRAAARREATRAAQRATEAVRQKEAAQ